MNELMLFLTEMSIVGWTLVFWSAVYIVVLERRLSKLKRAALGENNKNLNKAINAVVTDEGTFYYD